MRFRVRVIATAALLLAGCGKKGPPLAPLHLIPGPPTALEIRRTGSEARLNLVLPAGNVNGGGPSVLDRVQIYAVTLAPGMAPPPNRELLTPKFLVGTIAVKPPPVEGEPAPAADAPPDPRPSAGDKATFVETLTAPKLAPVAPGTETAAAAATSRRTAGTALLTAAIAAIPPRTAGVPLVAAATATPTTGPAAFATSFAIAASAAVTAAIPKYSVRLYAAQGATKSGRPGQPSARAELPLIDLPGTPSSPIATVSEKSIALTWVAPPGDIPPTFNVYKREGGEPLNPAPLAAPPFEQAGVTWGTEVCFVVRAVEKIGAATMEGDASDPACVTPRDIFPPAAPKGLSIVAGPGSINLSWDANQEPDLGGYLVLRGEAPGDTLLPLTPAPIAATNFEDKSARPGVRYAYAIVAIDKASPPNRSAPSARVEETAR